MIKKVLMIGLLMLSNICNAALIWEKVEEAKPNSIKDITFRARVPHGWFVAYAKKSYHLANETIDFGTMFFYPDENHEWTL